jgi:ArsR family transcriptional regulator
MWQSVEYYKALSNPKRLAILKLIKVSEKTVGDIAKRLQIRQANVSQHLMFLRQVGIIGMRRNGKYVYYHLKNKI